MFIGIINNSNCDRCNIYTFEDEETAAIKMYEMYKEDYRNDEFENKLATFDSFLYDALGEFSACNQASDYHINYEIHRM